MGATRAPRIKPSFVVGVHPLEGARDRLLPLPEAPLPVLGVQLGEPLRRLVPVGAETLHVGPEADGEARGVGGAQGHRLGHDGPDDRHADEVGEELHHQVVGGHPAVGLEHLQHGPRVAVHGMPTFYFSDGEIQKIVRFFAAMSSQASPYIADRLEPLTDQERTMARQLFSSEGAPCLKCHATGAPKHAAHATAPSFLLAKERLKPGWARRWMLDPAMMSPGTAMPSGLFRPEGDREVFAGPTPASFNGYTKDHAQLLVRYMFQFTPEELTRLRASAGN